jgi:hypothetical protein
MSYTAFADSSKLIASGQLLEVALEAKTYLSKHARSSILIFDNETSRQMEIDFRGSKDDVRKRLEVEALPAIPGPGRPKLGVVAREVTLLPSHWDWLALQPGGASVTLRKLVDAAKKKNTGRDEIRQAQDAAYKFMTVMAGDRPHYEEALRALYAKDKTKFKKLMEDWPKDIRDHSLKLAAPTF